jgi:mRNA interferase MazF
MNQHLPIVIAAPLTTKIKNYKGNPILTPKPINGLKQKSELLIFHVRSISKDRLVEKAGNIDKTELAQAIKTLNDILTY